MSLVFLLFRQELIDNSYKFTSREFDLYSGLYYYRARYYSAIVGRFITKDPIGTCIFLISISSLYRLIFHSIFLSKLTLSEIKNILSTGKIPLAWYLDSIIINCGMLLVVIGFALIVFVKEKE